MICINPELSLSTRENVRPENSVKNLSYVTQSVCMDFQNNLPLPNISTKDVYYKRQLSLYSFNIHQLSNNHAVFYAYTEVIGKERDNKVVTFLYRRARRKSQTTQHIL